MSEATAVQAFWSLAIIVGFVGGLVVLAAIVESRAFRSAIEWANRRRPAALARWEEMLSPDLKDYAALAAEVRRKEQ